MAISYEVRNLNVFSLMKLWPWFLLLKGLSAPSTPANLQLISTSNCCVFTEPAAWREFHPNKSEQQRRRTHNSPRQKSEWVSEWVNAPSCVFPSWFFNNMTDYLAARTAPACVCRVPPPRPALIRANRVWLCPSSSARLDHLSGLRFGKPDWTHFPSAPPGHCGNPVWRPVSVSSERRLLRGYVRLLVTQTARRRICQGLKSLLIKYWEPSSSLPSSFSLLSFHVNLYPAPGLRPGSVGIQSICWDY